MRYLLLMLALIATPLSAKEKPVVDAVLFYSPKCPHCHKAIEQTIKPLTHKYGAQFQLVMVDIDTPEGQELFQNAMRKYSVPKSKRVVPFMIVGSTLLIGSDEIERRLSFLIDKGLAAGGRKLPNIKGLAEAVPNPT
ncbi:MAG: thioredoxin family protein [Parachlamydiales bacterium]